MPSGAVSIGRAPEDLARPEAKARQREGGRAGGQACGKLPQASGGKTRDRVAGAVGMSGGPFEKARAVVEAAVADPKRYGRLLEARDRTGRVDDVYRGLVTLRQAEATPPA